MRYKIVWLMVLILLLGELLTAQEKIGCYFNIVVNNETTYLSDYSLKNMIVKVLENNLPSEFYRSYNDKETFQVTVFINLIEVKNLAGVNTGIAFSIYAALRTWPLNLAFMPEDMTIGVTGDRFGMDFIKTGVDNLSNKIFGQYDLLKEVIRKSLEENRVEY